MTDFLTIEGDRYARAACPSCGVLSLFPRSIYDVAFARRPDVTIYCPNGHGWHYTLGETDLDRMRRERDRLKQSLAQRDDEIQKHRLNALAWQAKAQDLSKDRNRLKKRAGGGVCPCCSRHFVQMERHMKTKHPTFAAVAAE